MILWEELDGRILFNFEYYSHAHSLFHWGCALTSSSLIGTNSERCSSSVESNIVYSLGCSRWLSLWSSHKSFFIRSYIVVRSLKLVFIFPIFLSLCFYSWLMTTICYLSTIDQFYAWVQTLRVKSNLNRLVVKGV